MQMVRLAGIIERSDQSVECGSEEPEDEMFYDCLEPTVWALQGGPIVALDLQQVETEETAFYMIQMVSVPEMEEEKCQVTLDSGADVCRAIPTIPVFYMRAKPSLQPAECNRAIPSALCCFPWRFSRLWLRPVGTATCVSRTWTMWSWLGCKPTRTRPPGFATCHVQHRAPAGTIEM